MSAHEGLPHLRETRSFPVSVRRADSAAAAAQHQPGAGLLAMGTLVGPYGLGRLVEYWPWLEPLTFRAWKT